MKKEDLRPIEYRTTAIPQKGYFHHWLILKDEEGSEYTKAFIETEDGKTMEVQSSIIQFKD